MTVGFEAKRVARSLGIVVIFAIVGPLVATAVFGLFVMIVGVPVLQLMLELIDLQSMRAWLSVTVFLLVFFALATSLLPVAIAGLAFAVAAVYGGATSLWTALVIMGVVVIGMVTLGFFVSPSESSPLLLPSLQGLRQGAFLSLFLFVPAGIAATACWLFSRPLHRVS